MTLNGRRSLSLTEWHLMAKDKIGFGLMSSIGLDGIE